MINVLDKGYVKLVDKMGSDLSVVNAARASYNKESTELNAADEKLINFLIREGHYSPMRHAFMTFEMKAPLMVARQAFKYIVGSDHSMDAWNENSYRYISLPQEFYVPTEWRSKPENSKQGSGEPLTNGYPKQLTTELERVVEQGLAWYNRAIELGVAPEQARLFLPAYGLYVNWRWSASLQSALHFIRERVAHDAQSEIREYAYAVRSFVEQLFPVTYKAFMEYQQ